MASGPFGPTSGRWFVPVASGGPTNSHTEVHREAAMRTAEGGGRDPTRDRADVRRRSAGHSDRGWIRGGGTVPAPFGERSRDRTDPVRQWWYADDCRRRRPG